MKTLLALAAAVSASASGALACDIGRFPDAPERLKPEVIALGRVDKVTVTRDAPAVPETYTATADIVIDRVALGALAEKSWRLTYPTNSPNDFLGCVFANEGPQLNEGQGVALYFRTVSGKLTAINWFDETIAARLDPRLDPNLRKTEAQ